MQAMTNIELDYCNLSSTPKLTPWIMINSSFFNDLHPISYNKTWFKDVSSIFVWVVFSLREIWLNKRPF